MIDGHPLASHCAQYILPVGLVFGRVMIDDILRDRQRHPEVARLSSSMELVHDPELDVHYPERYTSIVELFLTDGRTLSRRVDDARGTPQNPLTAEEIRAKYVRLTEPVVPGARRDAIMAAVDGIDRARSIVPLAGLLRQKPGAARRRSATGPGRTLTRGAR